MIGLTNFFSKKNTSTTAQIAKERLQIIVSERKFETHHLLQLKNDLLKVISKHISKPQIISMQLQKKDKTTSILKLEIFF